ENAGTEHVVTHGHEVRDMCTLLRFPVPLLEQMASCYWKKTAPQPARNQHFDFPYAVIASSPALDSLHLQMLMTIVNHPASGLTLKMEELEMELLRELFIRIY